jgi:hypothetical protein
MLHGEPVVLRSRIKPLKEFDSAQKKLKAVCWIVSSNASVVREISGGLLTAAPARAGFAVPPAQTARAIAAASAALRRPRLLVLCM